MNKKYYCKICLKRMPKTKIDVHLLKHTKKELIPLVSIWACYSK